MQDYIDLRILSEAKKMLPEQGFQELFSVTVSYLQFLWEIKEENLIDCQASVNAGKAVSEEYNSKMKPIE